LQKVSQKTLARNKKKFAKARQNFKTKSRKSKIIAPKLPKNSLIGGASI